MLIAVLAGVVAVAAAIRSTWSPCGQSMLSTITPIGELGRGNRFGRTATWFVLGAVLGGATLGLGAALLAATVGALGIGTPTALALGALLAILAAVADAGLFGIRVPYHRRQVNELWLDDYRSWVYGGGFGFQIGLGFATFIMTSGLVLLVALAALTGNPWTALGIGILFGLVRGLGVLPGARLTTPAKLVEFHRRFDARSATSRHLVIVVELAVAFVAASAVAGLLAGVAVSVATASLFVAGRRSAITKARGLASS
ncbi:MAG: hypothetical protein ACXVKA_00160 [Acidimicrobiia bacterium]